MCYRTSGGRLFIPDGKPYVRSIYNNDPHTLIRFDTGTDPQAGSGAGEEEQFTLVLAQMKKRRDTRYTLSVFSSVHPFRLRACDELPPYKVLCCCVCCVRFVWIRCIIV